VAGAALVHPIESNPQHSRHWWFFTKVAALPVLLLVLVGVVLFEVTASKIAQTPNDAKSIVSGREDLGRELLKSKLSQLALRILAIVNAQKNPDIAAASADARTLISQSFEELLRSQKVSLNPDPDEWLKTHWGSVESASIALVIAVGNKPDGNGMVDALVVYGSSGVEPLKLKPSEVRTFLKWTSLDVHFESQPGRRNDGDDKKSQDQDMSQRAQASGR
jgi:hypothetical protein